MITLKRSSKRRQATNIKVMGPVTGATGVPETDSGGDGFPGDIYSGGLGALNS